MATAVITSRGQITLPKQVRLKLGVEVGDRIEFVETTNGAIMIVPATRDIRELKGIVSRPEQPVTIEEMNRAIAKMGSAS